MHNQSSGNPDTTEDMPGFSEFDDSWRSWIAENLVLGAPPESLLPVLVSNNFHPGEAQREIDKAQRSPYLKPSHRLVQRVAKRDWMLASNAGRASSAQGNPASRGATNFRARIF